MLAFLQLRGHASALEIGSAATRGERWAQHGSWQAKESIGLAIAMELHRQNRVRSTRGNQFELVVPPTERGSAQ